MQILHLFLAMMLQQRSVRIYPHPGLDPREHPTYHRRITKPPLTEELPQVPVFGGPRSLSLSNANKTAEILDQWLSINARQVWPSSDFFCGPPDTVRQIIRMIAERNMTLGQANGFHPDEPAHMRNMSALNCSAGIAAAVEILGSRFFGTSTTEAGSRYQGMSTDGAIALASVAPTGGVQGRQAQRLAFLEYFEAEFDFVGRRVVDLSTAINEPHLLLETGYITLVGTESSQGYGNDQVSQKE